MVRYLQDVVEIIRQNIIIEDLLIDARQILTHVLGDRISELIAERCTGAVGELTHDHTSDLIKILEVLIVDVGVCRCLCHAVELYRQLIAYCVKDLCICIARFEELWLIGEEGEVVEED